MAHEEAVMLGLRDMLTDSINFWHIASSEMSLITRLMARIAMHWRSGIDKAAV